MKQFARISALVLAMGAALVASTGAQAATVPSTFNVNITLTPKCEIATTSTDLTFAYESFQTGVQGSTGGGFTLKCTTGLIPSSFALEAGLAYTDAATNLAYTIVLPPPLTGTGADQLYAVTGSMIAGQAGTCAASGGCNNSLSANKQRTLTITY